MVKKSFSHHFKLGELLFILSLVIYLVTRIIKIEDFPPYFFCDEAMHGVKAEELAKNNLRDSKNQIFPLTINSTGYHNLGLFTQLNIPGIIMFGKKIWVVRITSVILSLFTCIFIALILRDIFKINFYWLSVLYISLLPLMFVFSRTGYEISTYLSFYAGCIYYYLLYRKRDVFFIYPAVLCAILAIYTSEKIWGIFIFLVPLLFLNDLFHHIKNYKHIIISLVIILISLVPLIKYDVENRKYIGNYLQGRGSFLYRDISNQDKLQILSNQFIQSVSPNYLFIDSPAPGFFFPFKNYAYFPFASLPFIVMGILYVLYHIKKTHFRILIITLLTSTIPAAITELQPPRIIILIIPLTCFFILGLYVIWRFLKKVIPFRFYDKLYLSLCFITLFFYCAEFTLAAILIKKSSVGDLNYSELQYGAKQLIWENKDLIKKYKFAYFSDFTFDSYTVAGFFLPPNEVGKLRFGDIESYDKMGFITDPENTLVFCKPKDCNYLQNSGLYDVKIIKSVPAPDKSPYFFVITLSKKK